MKSSYRLLLLIVLTFSFCPYSSFAEDSIIYINGSSTVDNILLAPNKAEIEKKANVTLSVSINGSEHGLRDLTVGRCDIAMISGTLQSLADNLNKQIPNFIQLNQFTEFKLGESSVVFIVNKQNSLDYLSSDDLRRICVGDVRNWKAIGGKDSRILFFTMERGDGVRTVVQDLLLKGDFFGVYTTTLRNGEVMNDMIAHLPEAIGTNNISIVDDSVKILKTDISLTQPLILVTNINARPEVISVINSLKAISKEKLPDQSKK